MFDDLPETDYVLFLIPTLAEIICEDVTDRIRKLHFSAYRLLQAHLNFYKERGYCEKLLCGIAKKKGQLILKTTSKAEVEKLIKPCVPHYNGAEFVSDEYTVPEEELICWSETSFLGPLNHIAYKRYMRVFGEVFPNDAKKLFPSLDENNSENERSLHSDECE